MRSILEVLVLKAVVFSVIMCTMNVGSGSRILRFCSVLIYVDATNVLLAEKSLRFDEICVT